MILKMWNRDILVKFQHFYIELLKTTGMPPASSANTNNNLDLFGINASKCVGEWRKGVTYWSRQQVRQRSLKSLKNIYTKKTKQEFYVRNSVMSLRFSRKLLIASVRRHRKFWADMSLKGVSFVLRSTWFCFEIILSGGTQVIHGGPTKRFRCGRLRRCPRSLFFFFTADNHQGSKSRQWEQQVQLCW